MTLISQSDTDLLLAEVSMPCLTIIAPTFRLAPERARNKKNIERLIADAKSLLTRKHSRLSEACGKIVNKLDDLLETIDFNHLKDGIGIYISPKVSKVILFPFLVKEKIKVDNTFDSRELLYAKDHLIDYLVLSISQKNIRLFEANYEALEEVNDVDFPIEYHENHEYTHSVRGTSFGLSAAKDFENDASVVKQIRVNKILHSVNHKLEKYFKSNIPIVISGGKKELNDFLGITHYKRLIIGEVKGNFDFKEHTKLAKNAWESVQAYQNIESNNLLNELVELEGRDLLVWGIENVYNAANEGKGLELVLERDLESHGYLSSNGSDLKKYKPFGQKKYVFINDAIELIIRTTMDKGGKVTLTNSDTMKKKFDGIALKLRYP
jgi:hypothetical protein